ncbi:hypothetical protein [Brochothrix campestris]|uniref:Uncharacterized protein n=1 Tax=Brochothrix campestris FSL F6-1037 TaxID=1265861 RepID=W7CDX3_9LIST|nr:hypothetical protein [Brochothrix campestris]EUJ35390.1 hypothetical protein BCAMP_11940 [Brochothrix campestris FSL F6-1037]
MTPQHSSIFLRFLIQLTIFICISVIGFYLSDWLITALITTAHWITLARLIAGCLIFTFALGFNQRLCYSTLKRQRSKIKAESAR